jgi:hypothetical protein
MKYVYPPALWRPLLNRWERVPSWPGRDEVKTPPRAHVTHMLNVAYHASLLDEESRPSRFRLAYCSPEHFDLHRGLNEPLVLVSSYPLTVSNLVRLAPSADPGRALIGVQASNSGSLEIWGIANAGSSWCERLEGHERSSFPPPDCLIVSAVCKGTITLSRAGNTLLTLRKGSVEFPSPPSLWEGVLFRDMRHAFEEATGHEGYAALMLSLFLERLLVQTRDSGHGGTFLFVPDLWNHADSDLRSRVSIKYRLNDDHTWRLLSAHCAKEFEASELRDRLSKQSSSPVFVQYAHVEDELADIRALVHDQVSLIAGMSAVDGAVIVTNRLRLLGFGAEVTVQRVAGSLASELHTTPAARSAKHRFADFGTRHRSAFRFCSSHTGLIALIVSQDGAIRYAESDVRGTVSLRELDYPSTVVG